MNFYKKNIITSWIVFSISFLTYFSTVEPTASYWDCSEYIATSAKLQVGHPPGAPLFQMLGAFFSNFSSSNESIAFWVNMMSVFASSFTIFFLYLSLSQIIKKFVFKNSKVEKEKSFLIIGASAIGALTYAFSDSFWFNAVEAEVYAMAMLITSALFWMALRWENEINSEYGNRWILAISFLIGLSFGVHFMALLTIPAIGMLYYFKKYNFKLSSFLYANVISVFILIFIFKLLLPSTLSFFSYAEVFFVNSIGLPFNSGTVIVAIFLISLFVTALKYTHKKNLVDINTGILCILFILIGFSSWVMLPIRANSNTVINENAPTDARALLAYYNLEQYPETHLFYGPMFTDMYAGQDFLNPYKDDKPKFEKDLATNKYVIVNEWKNARINSNSEHTGFFPRMWSSSNAVNYIAYYGAAPLFKIKDNYKNDSNLKEIVSDFYKRIDSDEIDANDYHNFLQQYSAYLDIKKPSFFENLNYFLKFQLNYMYFRYFMWNFSGKQNDLQGKLDKLDGNWITGIPIIDSIRLGPQSKLTDDMKKNKGRNTYFLFPLLLGILGLLLFIKVDIKRSWVIFILFIFTGIALKFYLNERVFEPRERDYALVGSFYAFSILIGIGVIQVSNILKSLIKKINTKLISNSSAISNYIALIICLLLVPFLMAYQNWDDHNRSGRYTAQSTAKAYLDSIERDKDAIIFTIGDNDTFALWYAQEIENYRTDVRTINTQLLATDWYIDQLKRKTYESSPIPSQLIHKQYVYGTRDYIKFEPIIDTTRWTINNFMSWVASDNPRTYYSHLMKQYDVDLKRVPLSTQKMVYYPTNKIRVPVNKKNVIESGIVKEEDFELIVDYIDIDLPKSGLYKNRLMMLDILNNNDWKRPIYFTGGSFQDEEYIWMKDYLQLEGLVYKLVPIKTPENPENPYQLGRIDSEKMLKIIKKWDWGNSKSRNIYHDPETRKNSISFRSNLVRLADKLIQEEKFEKAEEVLDIAMENMPVEFFGFYSLLTPFVSAYQKIDRDEKANSLATTLNTKYIQKLNFFKSFNLKSQQNYSEQIYTEIERYRNLVDSSCDYNDKNGFCHILIQDFIKNTSDFSLLYSAYEYFLPMTNYISILYSNNLNETGRLLFESISSVYINQIKLYENIPQDEMIYYKESIETLINNFKTLVENFQLLEMDLDVIEKANNDLDETIKPFLEN